MARARSTSIRPRASLMVEFAFDVLQVAGGAYAAQDYRDRIGFHVSKRLLEQAVQETYGLELGDMLLNVDLAIGTYRHAVSTTIPEMTGDCLGGTNRDEIVERTPEATPEGIPSTPSHARTTNESLAPGIESPPSSPEHWDRDQDSAQGRAVEAPGVRATDVRRRAPVHRERPPRAGTLRGPCWRLK